MNGDRNYDNPLVSVIIPAFNAERTITRALQSVQIQNYDPLEIIVVDDGSTDNTRGLVSSFPLSDIRLIAHERNQGECAAMNTAIHAAAGEFIAFLDADDEWLPGKLEKQIARIQHNPKISMVTCAAEFVTPDLSFRHVNWDETPPAEGPDAWKALLKESFIAKPSVVARRATLLAVGGFDPDLKVAGDQDMWIRLALAGEVGAVHETLLRVYQTRGSLMRRHQRGEVDHLIPMVERHVAALRGRLSAKETRQILGYRYSRVGRNLCGNGDWVEGVRWILRGIALGYRPLSGAYAILTSAPPIRITKRKLRLSQTDAS